MPPSAFSKPKASSDGFKFVIPETVSTGKYGRIAKGKYPGKIINVTADTSKAGNPMWVWEAAITKGDHAGRDFRLYTALTDDAAWKVVEVLAALGQECEPGEEVTFNRKDVIGVGCMMVIVDSEYNGKEGSSLDAFEPHPKGAGYKGGAAIVDEPEEEEEEEAAVDEEEEEEEEQVRKAKPAPSKGKAKPSFGKRR